ncbi:hypothetical protein Y032_0233g3093 [Ancylostoma ceylanicum]|uniref:Uncharacterized protein n=1 Tax=Ancylostoma ceylanicum TaxID=53326 RepID=A0A016SFC0_9BILA|nr:hypothetical protein Y032_0233g3093 [Ancylostoma ceylanicum]
MPSFFRVKQPLKRSNWNYLIPDVFSVINMPISVIFIYKLSLFLYEFSEPAMFFHDARFSDGPRNNGIMNLKVTCEILNMSPGDRFYQCFQNGVDVIEF